MNDRLDATQIRGEGDTPLTKKARWRAPAGFEGESDSVFAARVN